MPSLNRVYLIGNLTRDPEFRQTPGGQSVAELGVAISESFRNKAGEMVNNVCYVDVETWGRQAELCQQYLKKGAPVMIEGRLRLDQWENQQGEKRSKLRVTAQRVQFLGAPRRDGAGAADPAPRPARDIPPPPPAPESEVMDPAPDEDNLPF